MVLPYTFLFHFLSKWSQPFQFLFIWKSFHASNIFLLSISLSSFTLFSPGQGDQWQAHCSRQLEEYHLCHDTVGYSSLKLWIPFSIWASILYNMLNVSSPEPGRGNTLQYSPLSRKSIRCYPRKPFCSSLDPTTAIGFELLAQTQRKNRF